MSTQTETTVLVVEDEDSFVEALSIGLRREGFRVQIARDGAQALDLFDAVNPDLVLLDVMLPRVSGIDVCRQLRKRSQVPIIMVTAKGAEIDTVVGLEVGADDYVTKPYRLRELVARMRAVLRRSPRDRQLDASGEALEVGDVALDPERHEVVISRSPFRVVETFRFRYERHWTMEQVSGYCFSTSCCSVKLLGENKQAFEDDLRTTLTDLEPSGVFAEPVELEAFLLFRG